MLSKDSSNIVSSVWSVRTLADAHAIPSGTHIAILKRKPTIPLLLRLLQCPTLTTLVVSHALRRYLSPRALSALARVGVKVKVSSPKRGRPQKLSSRARRDILRGNVREKAAKWCVSPRTIRHYRLLHKKRISVSSLSLAGPRGEDRM